MVGANVASFLLLALIPLQRVTPEVQAGAVSRFRRDASKEILAFPEQTLVLIGAHALAVAHRGSSVQLAFSGLKIGTTPK